ncbi:MAG: hypothetical protein QM775_30865 [Pirellulales bacterium]
MDRTLKANGKHIRVILDNVHRLDAQPVVDLLTRTEWIEWTVLSQPSQNVQEIVTLANVSAQELSGWTAESIGELCNTAGCPVDYPVAVELQSVTGGIPLFVRSLIQIAQRTYEGNVKKCVDDIKSATHATRSAQEVVLGKIWGLLDDNAKKLLAALALSEVPLSREEVYRIAERARSYVDAYDGVPHSKSRIVASHPNLATWHDRHSRRVPRPCCISSSDHAGDDQRRTNGSARLHF